MDVAVPGWDLRARWGALQSAACMPLHAYGSCQSRGGLAVVMQFSTVLHSNH